MRMKRMTVQVPFELWIRIRRMIEEDATPSIAECLLEGARRYVAAWEKTVDKKTGKRDSKNCSPENN